MKTTRIILAALLLSACSVSAQAPATPAKYKPEELKAVPNISIMDRERQADLTKNEGKIVRMRISCRAEKPKTTATGIELTVLQAKVRADAAGDAGRVTMIVPTEGQAWATSLPVENKRGKADEFVYVRVTSAAKDTVEALGTKIVNGLKGPELVW